LGRTQVVEAAVALLDEVGLEALTLRRVATRLGVQAPALYWYVKSKQDLLDQIATAIAAESPERPPPAREAWPRRLGRHGRELRELLLRHRDGAMVVAQTGALSQHWPPAADVTAAMVDAGMAPADANEAVRTVRQFVLGYTLDEQAASQAAGTLGHGSERRSVGDESERESGDESAREPGVESERRPTDASSDAREDPARTEEPAFESALRIIIDGLRVRGPRRH